MGVFDDVITNNEPEWEDSGGFVDAPTGKWFLVRALGEDAGRGACAVEEPNEYRDWHVLRLGFEILGAEDDVPKANYGGLFHRCGIDSKDSPGVPNSKVKGLANKFFAAGMPHGDEARTNAAKAVLEQTVTDAGMDPNDTENYPDMAVFFASTLAVALANRRPTLLVKTFLRKSRQYTTPDGEVRHSKESIQIGSFTDDSVEERAKHNIQVWGDEEVNL